MRAQSLLSGLVPFLCTLQIAVAQTPSERLEQLFTRQPLAEWFAPRFLQQVSAEQVARIVAQLKQQYGAFERVEGEGTEYEVILERAIVPTRIALDAEGRIIGLFFSPPMPRTRKPDELLAEFRQLPGTTSLLVLKNGREFLALRPDTVLAVGSSFKLAVLAALKDAIEAGRHRWDEVVRLQPTWKSLPSGFLHTWPDGSPLTLHTLAALMISQSDNTATDALLALLGREAVEAYAPHNRPFLSTREAFMLKNPANREYARRFLEADEAGRRDLLATIQDLPLPDASVFSGDPVLPEIEWFLSVRELCRLIESVHELPLTQINPGVARREDWRQVAFKGGSEPGVLNLTTYLIDKQDNTYCVSATWNDTKALEETRFFGLYRRLLQSLQTTP